MKFLLFTLVLLAVPGTGATGDSDGFVRLAPEQLDWQELRPGLAIAVIEGDPATAGFYIIRARFSPGTLSRPHYHPNDRFVTVLSGTWWTGIGTVLDRDKLVPLGPGSYMKHPAGAAHYDGSLHEGVVVEIKGMGPAPLIYVDEDGERRE